MTSTTKTLAPMRNVTPAQVVSAALWTAWFSYLAVAGHGWARTFAAAFAVAEVIGFIYGAKIRRKVWRRWMIADRAIARINALKTTGLPGVEDVFDIEPALDQAAFHRGAAFALAAVDRQIARAADEVDAL